MTKAEELKGEPGGAEHWSSAQFCLRLPLRMIMMMVPIMFCKLNVAMGEIILVTLEIKN